MLSQLRWCLLYVFCTSRPPNFFVFLPVFPHNLAHFLDYSPYLFYGSGAGESCVRPSTDAEQFSRSGAVDAVLST